MAPAPQNILFQSEVVSIGQFRCHPSHPHFEDTGPVGGHLVVFPRTSVRITHAGRDPLVADPNVVVFYNRQQEYRRSKLYERGDLCEFFVFSSQTVIDALRSYDPAVEERPDHPFRLTHGPSDSRSYLLQRLVTDHLTSSAPPDALWIEETMLRVLGRVIENSYRARGLHPKHPTRTTNRAHRALAEEARTILATRFHETPSLTELASTVHSSPFHLCRVFRKETNISIHRYLDEVRLRTALEFLGAGLEITDLALELGYSSHSHFTQAFRRAFGVPPSTLRHASPRRHREMSKILIA